MKDNIGISNKKNTNTFHNHFGFRRSNLTKYNLCENDVYFFKKYKYNILRIEINLIRVVGVKAGRR